MNTQENKEEDIQAWLDQVHFGSCCSDDPEDCNNKKEEEPQEEGSTDPNS